MYSVRSYRDMLFNQLIYYYMCCSHYRGNKKVICNSYLVIASCLERWLMRSWAERSSWLNSCCSICNGTKGIRCSMVYGVGYNHSGWIARQGRLWGKAAFFTQGSHFEEKMSCLRSNQQTMLSVQHMVYQLISTVWISTCAFSNFFCQSAVRDSEVIRACFLSSSACCNCFWYCSDRFSTW